MKGHVTWAGIKIQERKWFDNIIGLMASNNPGHEELIVSSIRKYVSEGETVVEIGGGSGVSAVVAANQVGKSGTVITYEASKNMVELIENTVRLNDAGDIVDIRHAIVSNFVRVMEMQETCSLPQTVNINNIPNCDTLIIDCDGCEFDILEKLSDPPRTIIVEHHAILDCEGQEFLYRPSRLLDLCHELGYKIINKSVKDMDEGFDNKFGEQEAVFVGRQMKVS